MSDDGEGISVVEQRLGGLLGCVNFSRQGREVSLNCLFRLIA